MCGNVESGVHGHAYIKPREAKPSHADKEDIKQKEDAENLIQMAVGTRKFRKQSLFRVSK